MAVDAEFLDSLGATVDETQAVGLAGLEVELGERGALHAGVGLVLGCIAGVVHLAVDEVVVGVGCEGSRLEWHISEVSMEWLP